MLAMTGWQGNKGYEKWSDSMLLNLWIATLCKAFKNARNEWLINCAASDRPKNAYENYMKVINKEHKNIVQTKQA